MLRRQLIDLDPSKHWDQVLLDVDLVTRICERPDSRLHRGLEPGAKKLVESWRVLLTLEPIAELKLRRS
jgi:hypothetical protein